MVLTAVLTVIHVVVCLVLIMVVLLQTGKRADLQGAFGGGGSQTAFGARGAATFLSRMTTVCAVIFMITSLSLAILASSRRTGSSVLDEGPPPAAATPAAPATSPGDATQPATGAPGDVTPSAPSEGDGGTE